MARSLARAGRPTRFAHDSSVHDSSNVTDHQLHAATLAVLSSKETKNQVLNWLALAINMSKKRTQDAYTYDNSEELRNEVGDDGFHLNLVAVMVALCKKYTSPVFFGSDTGLDLKSAGRAFFDVLMSWSIVREASCTR